MATQVVKTIKSSGGDYTSLSAWEAGQQADIVTADEQHTAECYSMSDTTAVTIDGWTTGATQFIEIITPAAERHDGKWSSGKYRLELANPRPGLGINEEYVRVEGIQLSVDGTWGINYGIRINVAGTSCDVRISHNIIRQTDTGDDDDLLQVDNGRLVKIWNNILYSANTTSSTGMTFASWDASDYAYLYNNTIRDCTTGFDRANNGNVVAKNNIAQDCTDGFNGTFHGDSTYNCSDITSDAPGSSAVTGEVAFVDESGTPPDLHLASGDTVAKDAGTDLSADANLAFSDDIDGDSRSGTWAIGADEDAASGGALLDASLSGTGNQVSSLTTQIKAKAAVSCAATVAAALTTAIVFAATLTTSASQAAALSTSITMNASANSAAVQSSQLTVLDIDLFDAAVTVSATAAGELATQIPFSAAAAGSVTTAAALTTQIQFSSVLTATISAASGLTTSITVDSAVSASCTVASELTAPQQVLLAASPTGTAAASAALTTGAPIENVVSYTQYFAKRGAADALFTKTFSSASYFTPKQAKEVWF